MEVGDGQGEHTVVVAVEESDAVGTDEGCLVLLTGVEDALFEHGSLWCLLAKTC